ncbi:PREDICTED: AT-rich interactive domain-containing protein 2 [Tarenaya hassleriana]|uniref:AT-rich interactive domain-containing protein 2 n=1 Tax=Tarenaya hassleriana TaxID=28532 RepID=UPI00053C8C3C|nr:PREDICTED: AT-rich interactive domain-containing protein 2 [Tarenaya hassleriana]XP_010541100.1 PREDICTED: AT-rich interactive domain-containing protein 2 [Tarenaya hassleriana]
MCSKDLERIEKWAMEKPKIVNWDEEDCQSGGSYGAMLHELSDGLEGLLKDGSGQKYIIENGALVFGSKHTVNGIDGSELKLLDSRKRLRESSSDDEETSCVVLDDDALALSSEDAETSQILRAGKQEALPEMMKWLTRAAKCPHGPSVGVIPNLSKWKEHTGNEYWIQVIRAKEALLVQRRNTESRTQHFLLQVHQKMDPSMYEDDRQTESLRCSIRRLDVSKTRSCSCCNESPVHQTKLRFTKNREPNRVSKTETPERTDPVAGTSRAMAESSETEIPRRHVPVGPLFQARVPQWTDPVSDSDSKWLGTSIWPLESEENIDSIGKGRPESCRCRLHGSVECVRFHIAEKRMDLKRELGPVFFLWRFNQMGEEVSLGWTDREEKRFKDMVRSDSHWFWENASKCFPRKTRRQLVSYYFNVFLINRRRYQNLVTPRHVDSDDDETDFGSVGYSFGHEAVRVFGSDIMTCSENKQCSDLD